jgi:hypothetical protein
MRFIMTVLATLVLAFLLWMLVAGILSYWDVQAVPGAAVPDAWSAPDSWSEWRDISIVFMAVFWTLGGILMVAVMVALLFVVGITRKVLKENAAPALDSLRQSLDNVRGTTEFAGETVASPIIRTYAVFKGVRTGLGAVTGIGSRITGRKKKKKGWL